VGIEDGHRRLAGNSPEMEFSGDGEGERGRAQGREEEGSGVNNELLSGECGFWSR